MIELIGSEAVRQKVGTSPTGLPFNSVMALELHSRKPLSPLVNAGAIATVSLVPGDSAAAQRANATATYGILASVGLTFFAYAGFGMMANAAGSIAHPTRTIPQAIYPR